VFYFLGAIRERRKETFRKKVYMSKTRIVNDDDAGLDAEIIDRLFEAAIIGDAVQINNIKSKLDLSKFAQYCLEKKEDQTIIDIIVSKGFDDCIRLFGDVAVEQDARGDTLLIKAARRGLAQTFTLLHESGLELNCLHTNYNGNNFLHVLVETGNLVAARKFFDILSSEEKAALTVRKNAEGKTPYDTACGKCLKGFKELFQPHVEQEYIERGEGLWNEARDVFVARLSENLSRCSQQEKTSYCMMLVENCVKTGQDYFLDLVVRHVNSSATVVDLRKYLMKSLKLGHAYTFETLIGLCKEGGQILSRDLTDRRSGNSIFHTLVSLGSKDLLEEVIRILCKEEIVNQISDFKLLELLNTPNSENLRPVDCAVKSRRSGMVDVFKKAGLSFEGEMGEKLLVDATVNGDMPTLLKLLEYGVSYDIEKHAWLFPYAVGIDNLELVELLQSQGMDVNAKYLGLTALHYAADGNNLSLVEYLLGQEADPYIVDGIGRTALHYAANTVGAYFGCSEEAGYERVDKQNLEVMNLLIENGPEAMFLTDTASGWTPLHEAAVSGNIGGVNLLGEKAPQSVNVKDLKDRLPYELVEKNEKIQKALSVIESAVSPVSLRPLNVGDAVANTESKGRGL
jgi:ankyrin repeat protein